jgi:hypothetical protein
VPQIAHRTITEEIRRMSNAASKFGGGAYYLVRYGDTQVRLWAHTARDAFDVVRNEYEAEWGGGCV